MVPVNLDLVREKAADIRGALDLLRDYGARPREEFLADETMVSAAKYQVILAVEAAQALCNHLVARVGRQVPASYADCFMILGDRRVISRDLATRLAAMAKFRNLLVHRYAVGDNGKVYDILQVNLQDLELYLRELAGFLGESI